MSGAEKKKWLLLGYFFETSKMAILGKFSQFLGNFPFRNFFFHLMKKKKIYDLMIWALTRQIKILLTLMFYWFIIEDVEGSLQDVERLLHDCWTPTVVERLWRLNGYGCWMATAAELLLILLRDFLLLCFVERWTLLTKYFFSRRFKIGNVLDAQLIIFFLFRFTFQSIYFCSYLCFLFLLLIINIHFFGFFFLFSLFYLITLVIFLLNFYYL